MDLNLRIIYILFFIILCNVTLAAREEILPAFYFYAEYRFNSVSTRKEVIISLRCPVYFRFPALCPDKGYVYALFNTTFDFHSGLINQISRISSLFYYDQSWDIDEHLLMSYFPMFFFLQSDYRNSSEDNQLVQVLQKASYWVSNNNLTHLLQVDRSGVCYKAFCCIIYQHGCSKGQALHAIQQNTSLNSIRCHGVRPLPWHHYGRLDHSVSLFSHQEIQVFLNHQNLKIWNNKNDKIQCPLPHYFKENKITLRDLPNHEGSLIQPLDSKISDMNGKKKHVPFSFLRHVLFSCLRQELEETCKLLFWSVIAAILFTWYAGQQEVESQIITLSASQMLHPPMVDLISTRSSPNRELQAATDSFDDHHHHQIRNENSEPEGKLSTGRCRKVRFANVVEIFGDSLIDEVQSRFQSHQQNSFSLKGYCHELLASKLHGHKDKKKKSKFFHKLRMAVCCFH